MLGAHKWFHRTAHKVPPVTHDVGFRMKMMKQITTTIAAHFCIVTGLLAVPDEAAVIGHRGAATAPENTLSSFSNGFLEGAQFIEVDIRTSADNIIVAFHDSTLDRTTDGTGLVSDATLQELKQLDAGSWFSSSYADERIPTLEEVFMLAKTWDRGVLLDVKTASASNVATAVSNTAFDPHNLIVLTWSTAQLSEYNAVLSDSCLLFSPWTQPDSWTSTYFENAAFLGADGLAFSHETITRPFLDDAKLAHMPVYTYTINSSVHAQQLLDYGVTGFTTDFPSRILSGVDWDTEFRIRSATHTVPQEVLLQWRAIEGDTYIVEHS